MNTTGGHGEERPRPVGLFRLDLLMSIPNEGGEQGGNRAVTQQEVCKLTCFLFALPRDMEPEARVEETASSVDRWTANLT